MRSPGEPAITVKSPMFLQAFGDIFECRSGGVESSEVLRTVDRTVSKPVDSNREHWTGRLIPGQCVEDQKRISHPQEYSTTPSTLTLCFQAVRICDSGAPLGTASKTSGDTSKSWMTGAERESREEKPGACKRKKGGKKTKDRGRFAALSEVQSVMCKSV